MRFRLGRVSEEDKEDTFIEINTLEELLDLVRKENKAVIINSNGWRAVEDNATWLLLVYDAKLE